MCVYIVGCVYIVYVSLCVRVYLCLLLSQPGLPPATEELAKWLSGGNVLKILFALGDEIASFVKLKNKEVLELADATAAAEPAVMMATFRKT